MRLSIIILVFFFLGCQEKQKQIKTPEKISETKTDKKDSIDTNLITSDDYLAFLGIYHRYTDSKILDTYGNCDYYDCEAINPYISKKAFLLIGKNFKDNNYQGFSINTISKNFKLLGFYQGLESQYRVIDFYLYSNHSRKLTKKVFSLGYGGEFGFGSDSYVLFKDSTISIHEIRLTADYPKRIQEYNFEYKNYIISFDKKDSIRTDTIKKERYKLSIPLRSQKITKFYNQKKKTQVEIVEKRINEQEYYTNRAYSEVQ